MQGLSPLANAVILKYLAKTARGRDSCNSMGWTEGSSKKIIVIDVPFFSNLFTS